MSVLIKIMIILISILIGVTLCVLGGVFYAIEQSPGISYVLLISGGIFFFIGICAGFYFSIEESLEEDRHSK